MSTSPVITRFPPSPTGLVHIGNIRTALFNYFFARQNNGTFVVRIEDTDKARSKKEYEEDMLESLIWLGLKRDGELWHQSERAEKYKSYLHTLIDSGVAYISPETEGENREVVRFKNPNRTVTFEDLIRGTVTFDSTELGDFIIARNINEPVYHLAVVVDDFEAGVTHIIRGEDHISNTPRQILIQEAIGAPRPIYAHLPLMLAPDRSKLSKRKHGEMVSLGHYRNNGFLPEAIVNYLALVGWHPEGNEEILSMDELIKQFDITRVQKAAAIFDVQKLNSINREYLLRMNDSAFEEQVLLYLPDAIQKDARTQTDVFKKILPIIRERISSFGDVQAMGKTGEFDYYFKAPDYEGTSLLWKGTEDRGATATRLQRVVALLQEISDNDFSIESIKGVVMPYADTEGRGAVLWPMRVALSGKDKSPDPFTLAYVQGRTETIARLQTAIKKLTD